MKCHVENYAPGKYRTCLGGVYAPRLNLDDARTLAQEIDTLIALRGVSQAQIRLVSKCIIIGINE